MRDLLSSFEPVDPTEAEHARRMRQLVEAPEPFARSAFAPGHFTASAFVLSPDERSLLLILHGKLGRWLQELFRIENRSPPRDTSIPLSGGAAANVLVVALVALTLAVLGFVVVGVLKRRRESTGPSLEVSTVDAAALAGNPDHALSRPPEGWAHLADALAARGEYREAVRNLYLALLSRLHRDGG